MAEWKSTRPDGGEMAADLPRQPEQTDYETLVVTELLDQLHAFADDSFARAHRAAGSPPLQAGYLKQAMALTKTYTSVLGARDRHADARRKARGK